MVSNGGAARRDPSAQRPPVLSTILVKPAGPDCNLDCEYCFYLRKAALFPEQKVHRMSDAVLAALVRQMLRLGGPTTNFIWQGGEPTLMGLPFFQRAVQLQMQYGRNGQAVANALQTNGLLLDAEWAQFLRAYRFLVGLSIDGPQDVHDRFRVDRGGQPSWERVARAARLLLDAGVAVNALAVVTGPMAHTGRERYRALVDLGFQHLQFIPCVERDPQDPSRPASYSVTGEQYGRFLLDVFDCWRSDLGADGQPKVFVRNFDALLHTYVGMNAPDCTLLRTCGVYLAVEHNGDVYPCDFYVEPSWRLGNVLQDDLQVLFRSAPMETFGAQKRDLPQKCRACKYQRHCYGGCPKDRWDSSRPGLLCEATLVLLGEVHEEFKRLARRVERRWERQAERARTESADTAGSLIAPRIAP